MSQQEDDIKQYGAEDLQRYHSGNMTEKEMHALEKAALDDPFLADALEGYVHTQTAAADINELTGKIIQRGEATKIVKLKPNPLYFISRIAAILILMGGLGWLFFKKDNLGPDKDPTILAEKSVPTAIQDKAVDTTAVLSERQGNVSIAPGTVTKQTQEFLSVKDNTADRTATKQVATGSSSNAVTLAVPASAYTVVDSTKTYAWTNSDVEKALNGKNDGLQSSTQFIPSGRLKGTVTDNSGKPVAFASVIDKKNNVSTQTNADGVFDLTSSDSVMFVNVNAVGYKSASGELSNNNVSNNLVLEPVSSELKEVVVQGYDAKRKNAYYSNDKFAGGKDKDASGTYTIKRVTVTNATPVNGWENFNKYATDSLKTLQQLDPSSSSVEVLVSFDVNDKGEPVNISVDNSVCKACNQEAVRIIQSGPAWKLNKKKKKAKAVVRF